MGSMLHLVMAYAWQNVSLLLTVLALAFACCTDRLGHDSAMPKRDVWCVLQSFLTLYAACVKELVSLLDQCPQTEPALEDPNGVFITPAELRIQSLVPPPTSLLPATPSTACQNAF